ncbi:DUF4214 domain-containing protein [Cellulomonas sp. ATA003]|uniref:DUF4214 domain-containing protein n=1 Tax=Cellulomonas sp. ATA003 TaxID=3073064 RepID=UPI0028736BE1|nr:DUF4214 domain-containing protein [Cellulomonas sp. ATA003]WNB87429.1 DUF4214 domain-containing protein [Cellulomonas sp. ATA003]
MAAAQTAPRIISRGQWGAPAPTCRTDSAAKLVGAVVHHTAGSNSYSSVAQAMQQIRNDAKYHMTGRGWCDLGYNFVVDKWGNIYEGRAGSMTKAVIGVHAGGFNTGTVGVSMLGTYTAAPSAATQRAVGEVIGWRLGAYGVDPRGSMTYWTGAGQNSKYSNRNVTLPRIFGHRDVAYTACPGPGGYSALPAIREIAADAGASERFAQARSVVTALYHDLLGRAPDASGLAMWTGKLAAGVDQSELVYLLTRSDEYIALRVAQAYQTVLGRAPEPAGARHWLTEIRGGTASVDDVQRRFFDSDEFAIRAGGTFDSYASAVYRAALGRSISSMERPARAAQVASNGRGWVIDDVWFSTEAAARRAGTYYEVFLQRAPDSVGVAHWAGVLLNQSESAVRTGIAGSAEYRDRAVARYP